MTKKSFILIAHAIRELANGETGDELSPEQCRFVAWRFAEALRATNPRFDAERFLKACAP